MKETERTEILTHNLKRTANEAYNLLFLVSDLQTHARFSCQAMNVRLSYPVAWSRSRIADLDVCQVGIRGRLRNLMESRQRAALNPNP